MIEKMFNGAANKLSEGLSPSEMSTITKGIEEGLKPSSNSWTQDVFTKKNTLIGGGIVAGAAAIYGAWKWFTRDKDE